MGARVNTLHGAGLAMTLRKLSEQATERIWIVSPYIGRWPAVSALLGGTWWLGSTVTLQVITDVSDAGNVHRGTLLHLLNRGLVKTLAGVHAKIYIIDDQAIVASANLTETGFTKRREIAVLLGGPEATDTISLFKTWWETLAQELTPESIEQLEIEKPSDFSPEREGAGLPVLWPLPPKPDGALFEAPGGAEGGFASYQRFLKHYNEFAAAYAGVQRLWPDAPLFLETDAFLNYLFHEAEGKPSFEFYSKREPRKLDKIERQTEIEKWAPLFGKWARSAGDQRWRERRAATVKKLLEKDHIDELTASEVKQVVDCLNCMNALQLIKYKFLNPNNNIVEKIRAAWKKLVHGHGSEEERMHACSKALRFFGTSSVQELLGWYYPERYPIRNNNSDAGLRFFGYRV
jgi:hypothetical protein